ncbi:histidine-specific methyltransferase [Tricladium varicosporioides]|nr:histidine-specific methyltransferase [Hymenoscyphus varicosporioides]
MSNNEGFVVSDIGGSNFIKSCSSLLHDFFLNPPVGRKPFIDDIVLSSDEGLAQWPNITCLPSYYQTRDEITLLKTYGAEIAENILTGCSIIDLGSGDTRKIQPLLSHLESRACSVSYFSVDLSKKSLERGLAHLASCQYRHVKLHGLWGPLDDALLWCRDQVSGPLLLVSLGSMTGNDRWDISVEDLAQWAAIMAPNDRFLIGIDSNQDHDKIWASYHDDDGVFETFLRTGLAFTNKVLGQDWYRDDDWVLEGEFGEAPLVHRFVFRAVRDVRFPDSNIDFSTGDRIECYEGHKYTPEEMRLQFRACGMKDLASWKSPDSDIYEYLIVKEQ